ncbi:hypothetical protein JTB14_023635 [Gonioctena quinquepunctata]|nr:hypothetical protein JTB14_023635 [Gonioctena quinquepunctata]
MFYKIRLSVFCAVVSITLFSCLGEPNKNSLIVTLPYGKILGHELRSYKDKPYYAFQEIPYASPPIGGLRFKEAIPPGKLAWNSQHHRKYENCLYINVYTPVNPNKQVISSLLPVYVVIHGGFFCKGNGTFQYLGPQFLMDYEIILVTVNYRLGPFGFLSTEDDVIPGNLGLKDQHLALEWVRDNIHLFGGDPKKVTLGGQSAAAAAVGHHILTKESKGLFRAAIIQSGSPLCAKMFQKNPRHFAFKLGTLLNGNFGSNNSSLELLKVLQDVPAEDIKKNSDMEIPLEMRNSIGNEDNRIWAPVEDGSFVKGPMHEHFKTGNFNVVPVLMGITSEEQIHFNLEALLKKVEYFDSKYSILINGNLNMKEENKTPAGEKLKKIYTDGLFEKNIGAFVRYISDAKYTTATIRQADLQCNYTDVYFYQFSYHGLLNNNNVTVPGAGKVGHEEDLNYLFGKPFLPNIRNYPEADLETQERMLKLWTNFIKYLDPTPSADPLFSKLKWPKMKPDDLLYVDIGEKLGTERNPREYQKWKEVFDEYAEEFQITY